MRATLSLNGLWKFLPTLEDLGGNLRWMDGAADAAAEEPGAGLDRGWINEGFDDSKWMDCPVPSSWNAAFEDLFSYEGHGWYRRTVMIPAAWNGRRVEFVSEGANYRTVVYVNGKFAGEHEGGYNPFALPVHPLLRYGEMNTIAVACDNEPKPDRAPGGQFGWWNNGGLYRDVFLRVTDSVYVDDVTVVTKLVGEQRAEVEVRVVVKCERDGVVNRAVMVDLSDPAGRAVPVPSADRLRMLRVVDGRAEAEMTLVVEKPLLWSPEQPNLYSLTVSLSDTRTELRDDAWSHRIGLRTIAVDGTKLLLNGRPLLVKGVNRHEQYEGGTLHTPTHSEASLSRDVDLIKWLGANAVRQHYPNHRRLYDLCDERGILAMVEVPLWQWGRPLVETDHPDALAAAKRQLNEIIKTYKNHACVFMWSVSNENLVKPKSDDPDAVRLAKMTADGNKELVALVKKLDPTRPVVEVSNEWPGDPVHEVTDVSAVNVYVGAPNPPLASNIKQVYPHIRTKLEGLREQVPGKPILVSEFGKWTVRGLLTPYPPGEEYQAAKLRSEWEEFLKEPGFVGGFIWVFADADVHRRFLWAHEFRVAYGLFDMKRRPKAAAYAVREMWKV